MKKSNKFLLFSIVFVLFTVFYKSYEDGEGFATSYVAKADTVVSTGSNIVCQIDGDVDESYADMVEAELSLIPAGLRAKFVESGWHIYVTDENLAKLYYNDNSSIIYGSTFYDKGIILMYSKEIAIKEATIHEVGHWFDNYLGTISAKATFTAVYNQESSNFFKTTTRRPGTSASEFFAEAFYFYIKVPNKLKNVAPKTYAFMEYYVGMTMQD